MRKSEKMRRRHGLKGFCPGASRMKEEIGRPQSTSRRGRRTSLGQRSVRAMTMNVPISSSSAGIRGFR